ncbi:MULTISPECIES: hypothetical protein [unclassified Streptomyces]|uniref:hypothetical protein n=1 Tax=unclassified Streptomyces TaxID=2593676 RepID=UPI001F04522F|nr:MULTISPECIES: hypothetical protein [unclassified Streptomyces]MCH0562896.1 hypothetical protein [Streptomyces sp. MUM 2J]MCH0571699.1 hypothetical protein [Streptomyces sp. MUM 136J]
MAESTIRAHAGRVLVGLGLRDRTRAAVFAYEARPVTPGRRGAVAGRTLVRRARTR